MGNHIKIVKGKTGYALYDLKNRNVYHLNYTAYNVIQKYMSGEQNFDKEEQLIVDILNQIQFSENLLENSEIDISPKLSYVWLEITEACNLNCIHCYGEWGHPLDKCESYLSCNEWKKIIDYIYNLGCRKIQFIGGEPLASSDFQELLIYAYEKGMKQLDVFTNGTLINDDLIDLFHRLHIHVRVSIYGHNANIHDRVTQKKGSFVKTITNIKKMQEKNIPVQLAVIIMNENESYISDIRNFASSFGSYGYDTIRKTTFGTQLSHGIKNVSVLSKRYQRKPEFTTSPKSFNLNKKWNSCWYGKIAITSKGDVIPCIFARECILGNIRKDTKEHIKVNTLKMWGITKDNIQSCRECEYRYACHDCRPLAKGLTGDITAKYPRCCYSPETGIWQDISDITMELNNNDAL